MFSIGDGDILGLQKELYPKPSQISASPLTLTSGLVFFTPLLEVILPLSTSPFPERVSEFSNASPIFADEKAPPVFDEELDPIPPSP